MKIRTSLTQSLALGAALGLGCAGDPGDPGDVPQVRSERPRLDVSTVPAAEVAALAQGNAAFALDLYKVLREKPGDLIYSPYSISLALAMTYGGARGATESQMSTTLRFPLPQAPLHPRWNALDQTLQGRGAGQRGSDGGPFRLRVANALWGQKDYAFQAPFLDLLAENYGAGLNVLDFQQAPEPSRLTINSWVSKKTEERIKDLLPMGAVSPATRLVLTNAVYFNAAWQTPFNKDRSGDAAFKLLDGSTTTVRMMSRRGHYLHAQGDGVQAVELPYQGEEVSLLVLLPDEGRFSEIERALSPALLEEMIGKLAKTDVILSLPRFESDSTMSLKSSLAALGITDLFSDGADLSGMNGRRDLYVSDVHHKAFIKVTEAGTEAGGATGVVVDVVSLPPMFTADRPFLYVLRDRPTGSLLFVGRVTNPKSP